MTSNEYPERGGFLTRILNGPYRFLIPFLMVILAKLIASIVLYAALNMGASPTYWMAVNGDTYGQNAILKEEIDQGSRWLYLFMGWDSSWYLSIIAKGYAFSSQSYAFFPGTPLFSWLINLILRSPALAFVVFSSIAGVLWIPFYQLVAEEYFERGKALKFTLVYAFFPLVFLFTTVAYSEGLFLLTTLAAWYLFKKKKLLPSMISASIAVISRPAGILILLPIAMEMLKPNLRLSHVKLEWRKFLYLAIPLFSFFSWLLYCAETANNWLAPFSSTAWNDFYSFGCVYFSYFIG